MADKAPEKKAPEEKALDNKAMEEMEARLMERLEAKMAEELAIKDKKIELLEEQLNNPYKENEQPGNARVMLYDKKHPKGVQFDEVDVPKKLKEGWVDSPAEFRTDDQKKPNPAPGEVVEGKVHK